MNAIFNKLKPHRKYHRKPMCENLTGICTFEKCRCFYPLMEPETKAKIDEYLHHRQKVIQRRREIELQKLDKENLWDDEDGQTCDMPIGNYRLQKERQAKYEKWAWRALWVLCGLVLLAGLFI